MANETSALTWEVYQNDEELTDSQHVAFAGLLARAFPAYADIYTGSHSWFGARPQIRVAGFAEGEPVAHLGILPRWLHIQERKEAILVADVGLVCVDPHKQHQGIGKTMLRESAEVMAGLEIPFGFLTCLPEVVPFYEAGNWQQLSGQKIKMKDADGMVQTTKSIAMALPVTVDISKWPHGCVLERIGQEV